MQKSSKEKQARRRRGDGILVRWKKMKWWTKWPILFSLALFIGFLTWLTIRMATMEAGLEMKSSFALAEGNKIGLVDGLSEKYAVAIDGQVVAGVSETEIQPTASTAKMILGLAIMREKPFGPGEKGETITITEEMMGRYSWYRTHNGSNTAVRLGEEISEYDALVSVFLASSNNMADALAIWAFGSLENYREYATEMLSELGFSNTTIGPDASGYDSATTSTAGELAQIGALVLAEPVLKEIVGLKSYEVPVAGLIENSNKILGMNRIIGVKTGFIGDVSGYCLVSGYMEGEHVVTIALLDAATRTKSFNYSLEIAVAVQNSIKEEVVATAGQIIGYYDSWWTGQIPIRLKEDLKVVNWQGAEKNIELSMSEDDVRSGILSVKIGDYKYEIAVEAEEFTLEPSFGERLSHCFGWKSDRVIAELNKETDNAGENEISDDSDKNNSEANAVAETVEDEPEESTESFVTASPVTNVSSSNCTIGLEYLMLINPNFTVDTSFIDARRAELVSVSSLYGIQEGNAYNGDNLLDAEAARHLNEMVKAYEAEYPGHTFTTFSCYRARGTNCGRLCAATGTSDHHTGLTCDLVDTAYGSSLDTDTYPQHIDWQWLYANSYKYGFIDRFPEEWAGGPMSAPLNVDENGSTGLFETWHYRYVGVGPATEIATGKYNNGKYDSLEHYLKARGLVKDLKAGTCN